LQLVDYQHVKKSGALGVVKRRFRGADPYESGVVIRPLTGRDWAIFLMRYIDVKIIQ